MHQPGLAEVFWEGFPAETLASWKAEGKGCAPMGGAPRKMGRGLQGQGEEAGFSPTGTGKCAKGPDQRGTFEGMEGCFKGVPWLPYGKGSEDCVDFSDQPDSGG